MENFKILYEDENVLAIDKPPGINSDDFPLRVHRLDKDTSGILLIAKNETALEFLQKQFQEREAKKKYIALAVGNLQGEKGIIETLLDRSPSDRRKQKAFLSMEPNSDGKRVAITEYRVIKRFRDYTLLEVLPKTGRKHQIRAHMAYLNHPLAGDKLYGFKNQTTPEGLKRQFLHASYLKINLPNGREIEIKSALPADLEEITKKLT